MSDWHKGLWDTSYQLRSPQGCFLTEMGLPALIFNLQLQGPQDCLRKVSEGKEGERKELVIWLWVSGPTKGSHGFSLVRDQEAAWSYSS